ncbi:MAG: rubredoxin [Candidatus Methanoplasma sp.]|jgi:glutamate synthase domain-containing protein 2/rubredoxin|nr:rubredoxin [Candidatus Methanoplasma sp.]
MARYRCEVCGEIYDEDAEGVPFAELPDDWTCPLCGGGKKHFKLIDDRPVKENTPNRAGTQEIQGISVFEDDEEIDGNTAMNEIHRLAATGKSTDEPMDTLMDVPGFDDILILGAQLARSPLERDENVNIKTVIGKNSAKPMVLDIPIYISHMSFGALSCKAKKALAKGSAIARTAMCSGEGGVLPEEKENAYRYIFEYVPNRYSLDTDILRSADAIEIKIGQGTKPGMGGHLPGEKVTLPISVIRGKPEGQEVWSPAKFSELRTPEDLKKMVDGLRADSGGRPIGVKIAAGRIEDDLKFISSSGCDFITIDGRGGATGSTGKFIKDASSVPTVYALARARRYMDDNGMTQELVITGGLRTSKDFVKAIAMGADAVAIASAALMALGCKRYRICHRGACPVGIATQDPELEKRLDVEKGAQKVANYLNATADELRAFSRATGHSDIHGLSLDDLCTISSEISGSTGIRHA